MKEKSSFRCQILIGILLLFHPLPKSAAMGTAECLCSADHECFSYPGLAGRQKYGDQERSIL
jgi:hypothetical protein